MKWQALLAGALASVLAATVAFADVRVTNDPGGEISSYVAKFREMRADGERLVIDGPCLSACTLFTAFIPRDHVCVTRRAVLGFHAASYFDDTSRSLVPTRAGTRLVMRLYPAANPRLDRAAWRTDAADHHACAAASSLRSITFAARRTSKPRRLSVAAFRPIYGRKATDARHCRTTPIVAAALSRRGGLILALAGTLWLWAHFGTVVFFETIRAGFVACFG